MILGLGKENIDLSGLSCYTIRNDTVRGQYALCLGAAGHF